MSEIRANYHTHCKRCLHAAGDEIDYVKQAIECGLSELGFSDHAPFPDIDYGYRMPYYELDQYFETVDQLKLMYSDKIKIYKSLEIEYMPQYEDYYQTLIKDKKVDYLLLGEHFYYGDEGSLHNIFSAPNTARYIEYANMIKDAAQTGYFDAIAHPDLCMINPHAWDENCEEAADIIIEAAEDTGIILECNANGFRRGISEFPDGDRYPYPNTNFWEKAAQAKVRVIVGSDCHNPSQVWDEKMDMAFEFLDQLGIKPLRTLPMKKIKH